MNALQKKIAIATLAFTAIFFHSLFCDWKTFHEHGFIMKEYAGKSPDESRLITSVGPFAGIYARSLRTYDVDAVLGVAFPVVLIGLGLFILAGGRSNSATV